MFLVLLSKYLINLFIILFLKKFCNLQFTVFIHMERIASRQFNFIYLFIFLLFFKVNSMSNVGLEFTILKLRVACTTHWVSQIPHRNPLYILDINPWSYIWFASTVDPWKTPGVRSTTLPLQFKTVYNFWLP